VRRTSAGFPGPGSRWRSGAWPGESLHQRAVTGLGDLIDSFEYHYPTEIDEHNVESIKRILGDKDIYCLALGLFYVGGYRADNFSRSTGATASGNCVTATLYATTEHTLGQVAEGAVRTTGNLGNRADSTALTGSVSHNGTRGLTTAPDLTGVSVVSAGPQQIAFTFDQNVDPNAIVGSGGFHFVTADGRDIASDTASVSTTDPATVIAQFPVGGSASPITPLVTDAVRAYMIEGAVQSQTIEHTPGTFDSQAMPGSYGQTTGVPDLVSAQYSRQPGGTIGATTPALLSAFPWLVPSNGITCGTVGSTDCVVVDYTFSQGVTLPLINTLGLGGIVSRLINLGSVTSHFYAYLSDGTIVHPSFVYQPSGTTVPVIGGTPTGILGGSTTVRAVFPNVNTHDEYLVKAAVTGSQTTPLGSLPVVCVVATFKGCGAVESSTPLFNSNTAGSAPIGGNTGAFATGFSTAPDAFRVTFDTLTNTASVLFDQRVFNRTTDIARTTVISDPANYKLLDANGNAIASANSISGCPPSTAGYPCPLATGATNPAPYTVYLGFASPAVQVGNGRALEIAGSLGTSANRTFAAVGGSVFAAGPVDYGNVQQSVSPASTADFTHLRAGQVAEVLLNDRLVVGVAPWTAG